MPGQLDSDEKGILSKIAGRFLRDGRGMPIRRTRVSLAEKRNLLDRLLQGGYLQTSGNKYLPTFLAVEQQDSELRNLGRHLVGTVLKALRNLYLEKEKDTFTSQEIMAAVNRIDATMTDNEVNIGLVLATNFDYFRSYSGRVNDEWAIGSVSLSEAILDFQSIDAALEKMREKKEVVKQYWASTQVRPPAIVSEPLAMGVDFSFLCDNDLRRIAARDYAELQIIRGRSAWKSQLVLTGGLIEALLLDALRVRREDAKASGAAEKSRQLEEWSLGSLIDVAVELGIIGQDAQKLGHSVRDYRNLVHPGREIRSSLTIDEPEAEIAVKVLQIVVRDLTKSKE